MRVTKSTLFGREVLGSIEIGKGAAFIRDLEKHNTLVQLIPELEPCIGFEGGESHDETVLDHLIMSLEWAEQQNYPLPVKLAALLHDVGKPATRKEENGKIHFHGHELVGASVAFGLCQRWEYPEDLTRETVKLIRHHMYKFDENAGDKAIKHWLFRLGPTWKNVILLRAADRRGNKAKTGKPTFTTSMLSLTEKCETIIKSEKVFREDIDIPDGLIEQLPAEQQEGIYLNLLGLIADKPERNNPKWLSDYVNRVYFHETP